MDEALTTAGAVIEALGGTAEAARKLGKTPQVISNWRSRGIPPEAYLIVSGLLEQAGKPNADPSVFRMERPQGADAA